MRDTGPWGPIEVFVYVFVALFVYFIAYKCSPIQNKLPLKIARAKKHPVTFWSEWNAVRGCCRIYCAYIYEAYLNHNGYARLQTTEF